MCGALFTRGTRFGGVVALQRAARPWRRGRLSGPVVRSPLGIDAERRVAVRLRVCGLALGHMHMPAPGGHAAHISGRQNSCARWLGVRRLSRVTVRTYKSYS
eukprot:4791639-Prymnesium_polylepis.1